jgi:small subunit ribosomal protein S4
VRGVSYSAEKLKEVGRRTEVGDIVKQFVAFAAVSAKFVPERSAVLYRKCAIESAASFRVSTGRRAKIAGYGLQLREKQKVKRTYGLLERQFRNYFEKAERVKGPTGENLIIMLERRLDNVVWRAGLASSRSQARQLVLHGHVRISGKKVNIPSYQINVGEEIAIKEKMHQNAMVLEARNVAQSQNSVPWLEQDREQFKAKVVALPRREDVQTPPINEQLIVELYSK